MKYILIAIYILCTTGGLFCFKAGGAFEFSLKNAISLKMSLLTFLGFCLYLCSFLLWQKLLATYDLSYIVPVTTGIVQIIVILLGYFFFKEQISLVNLIGIIMIIAGVVLLSIKK